MDFSKTRNKAECRCFHVKFRKATLKVQVLMGPPGNLSKQHETLILRHGLFEAVEMLKSFISIHLGGVLVDRSSKE